jgi:8-oxo-dGTP diphosphatase
MPGMPSDASTTEPAGAPGSRAVVVAAATVRDGRVLAARRTSPEHAAGRWELPGGKVDPGESPEDAVVREVREELACTVRVTGRLSGAQPVGDGLELRVLLTALVDGAPVPLEHDAVRWLGPEQLGLVDWLDPDRPFLPELRERLLDGTRLPGGNVGGAVRVGRTVRRSTGPWTPAVHRLLRHLAGRGVPALPEVLGTDERGREVLSFLPGRVVDVDTELMTEGQLSALGRWTRRMHEAVADLDDTGPWRFFGVDRPTLVAHNDLAPYNVCFAGDRLVGVFDWDLAGPSTPLLELAHLAWNAVPLFRPLDPVVAARRLEVLASSYDGPTAREVLDAVPGRVQLAVDGIRTAVAQGDASMRNLTLVGEPERTEAALAGLQGRLDGLRRELAAGRVGGAT